MSLQGTIETFAIADVLRLLAATNKTGRLQVQGVSRVGTVWVDSGKVLAAESPNTPHEQGTADVVFQLLRIDRGSFRFELDRAPAQPGDPVEIEAALSDAEGMLGEWRELERVVPSVDARVTLRSELREPTVTVSAEQWKTIGAVGGGLTVSALGDSLGTGELSTVRSVSQLVDLGLVDIGDAPATGELVPDAGPVAAPPEAASASPEVADPTGPPPPPAPPEVEEGDARRRLDALASSIGLPPVPNGAGDPSPWATASPAPTPVAASAPLAGFAPPPPAVPTTADLGGSRPDAGLTGEANGPPDTSGVTNEPAVESPNGIHPSPDHGSYGQPGQGYDYGQPAQPAEGYDYGQYGQPAQPPQGYDYGQYGQPAQPPQGYDYGQYGQPAQPPQGYDYGQYGQPAQPPQGYDYGQYGQPAQPPQGPPQGYDYGQYGQPPQGPAQGYDYGQAPGAPAPGDAGLAVPPPPAGPAADSPTAPPGPPPNTWEPAQPGTEAEGEAAVVPSEEVASPPHPTNPWPSETVARASTIFEATTPPPPPPPPLPINREGWAPAGGWAGDPGPERLAPPPPPPPPPVPDGHSAGTAAAAEGSQPPTNGAPADAAEQRDEDPANIERQLLHLSERAQEAVKRSSGLYDGRSPRS